MIGFVFGMLCCFVCVGVVLLCVSVCFVCVGCVVSFCCVCWCIWFVFGMCVLFAFVVGGCVSLL